MISAIAGLVAGALHVLSGPDHLAAIAPLAVDVRRCAWITGLRWGIGHATGVLVVGLLSLLLRDLLPLEHISNWSERLVGVLLIIIGCWGIRKAMQIHAHDHEHNGEHHVHLHMHGPKQSHERKEAHTHSHTAFGIGTIHGLAGSSHFLGVLPAIAFPHIADGVIYLISFGLGTVAAMSLFSTAISRMAGRFTQQTVNGYRNLMCCCSVATLLVGGYWLAAS
jgi:sulfite exporter TauE/SafE